MNISPIEQSALALILMISSFYSGIFLTRAHSFRKKDRLYGIQLGVRQTILYLMHYKFLTEEQVDEFTKLVEDRDIKDVKDES